MSDQLKELENLLDLKKRLSMNKMAFAKQFHMFKATKELHEKFDMEKTVPMPISLKIQMNGYINLDDAIQAIFDVMIAEVDKELAKFQTTKTTE